MGRRFIQHSLFSNIVMGSLLGSALLANTAFQPLGWAQSSNPEAIVNYNQGYEAYSQGRLSDALAKFSRAIQIDPAYGDAYYNIGSLYYQMKRYGDAADMFQKAVNLTPSDMAAKYNLALSLERLGRTEEAINILNQIPSSDPKYAQAKAKLDELRPNLKPQVATTTAAKPTVNNTKPATTTTQPKPAATTAAATASTAAGKLVAKTFSKGFDGPTGITIGPGGYMYVANYSKNLIYRVGAGGEKAVFCSGDAIKGPIGLAYNPKTNELYVANYLLNNVARVNASGKASVLATGVTKPYNLFLDTVNNALYVSEQDPANLISKVALP